MKTATDLLEDIGALLNANAFYAALKAMGLVEDVEYLSSTGSGEIKSYSRLTQAGLQYGENRKSAYSEKMSIVFRADRFSGLYVEACEATAAHARSLVTSRTK